MSSDSLALLRKNASQEIRALAEEHYKHDLQESDRDTLKSAAGKIGTHVTIGSIVGLGLGAFLAFRLRRTRMQMFNALRAHEKPTHVKFADGREGECALSAALLLLVPVLTSVFSTRRSYTRHDINAETLKPRGRRGVYLLWLWRPVPGWRDRPSHG